MSYRYANLPIEQVRPNAKNTRTHSKKQIRQIATSIRELGFAAPVVCTENLIRVDDVTESPKLVEGSGFCVSSSASWPRHSSRR